MGVIDILFILLSFNAFYNIYLYYNFIKYKLSILIKNTK